MDSQTQEKATVWLKPEQVKKIRSATVESSATYLAARNEALIATLYDFGLRVSEAIALNVDDHLDLNDGATCEISKARSPTNQPSFITRPSR